MNLISLKLPKFKSVTLFLTLDKNLESIITGMSNIQLLSTLENKLGLLLNSIKLMKLFGITKPSSKMEVSAELNQHTPTLTQFTVETVKLLTLFLTKACQDIKAVTP